jgi:hypothetical protein
VADEVEGIDAAVGAVPETGRQLLAADQLHRPRGLGVVGQKPRHNLRVRYAGVWRRLQRQNAVIESLRRIIKEDEQIHHRRPPLVRSG